MAWENQIAAWFKMDEKVWMRHSNPWSGITRYPSLPLLLLAVWSRVWLGWWVLLPIILVLVWIWLNPRFFPKPRSTDNWMSKAVFGERVWLNRRTVAIPAHHVPVINIINSISTLGGILCVIGVVQLWLCITVMGTIIVILAKTWFLDRMVWLYEAMRVQHAEYQTWLY